MKYGNFDGAIALPRYLRNYGASDYGTMEPQKGKKEPDYTEHGVWSIDSQGRLFARAWWSKQAETDKSVEEFLKLVRWWKPTKWWHEGGLIDKSLAPWIRKEMRRTHTFTVLEGLPSILDKGLKLQAFHGMVATGMVYGPLGEPWWERVIDQLIKFPGGRWDDAADVCGLMGRGLDQMFDPSVPVAQAKPTIVPYTADWLEYNERNQKPKVRYFS